jgi:hypothetical protein
LTTIIARFLPFSSALSDLLTPLALLEAIVDVLAQTVDRVRAVRVAFPLHGRFRLVEVRRGRQLDLDVGELLFLGTALCDLLGATERERESEHAHHAGHADRGERRGGSHAERAGGSHAEKRVERKGDHAERRGDHAERGVELHRGLASVPTASFGHRDVWRWYRVRSCITAWSQKSTAGGA